MGASGAASSGYRLLAHFSAFLSVAAAIAAAAASPSIAPPTLMTLESAGERPLSSRQDADPRGNSDGSDGAGDDDALAEAAIWDVAVPAARSLLSRIMAAVHSRRKDSPWEMAAPALMIGGTVAALMIAALGAIAGKALLSSILAAAISAMQLTRPPAGNGQNG